MLVLDVLSLALLLGFLLINPGTIWLKHPQGLSVVFDLVGDLEAIARQLQLYPTIRLQQLVRSG
jgi:hypothetical protein